mmetsp:Transcript_18139/g.70120  ORF Transcript_18139/g.70120 Transcript_18139/m.70120 type:complete len:514 (-) Transcript_18139:307-1848(-)
MALHVEEHASGDGSDGKDSGAGDGDGNGPAGEQLVGHHSCLLATVREVVVPRAHVVERARAVHAEDTAVEVGSRRSVELLAVGDVLLVVRVGVAVHLVNEGHAVLRLVVLEHGEKVVALGVVNGLVVPRRDHLRDVAAISLARALTVVVGRVGVAASPLVVDVIAHTGVEEVGDKVVLDGGVDLHDVAALAADVHVVDLGVVVDPAGTVANVEDMRAVLERAAILVGVQSHLVNLAEVDNLLVLVDRGKVVVPGGVGEVLAVESPALVVAGRDVVANANNAVVLDVVRDCPVVGRGVALVVVVLGGVAEVVRPGELRLHAVGGINLPRGALHPGATVLDALDLVVVLHLRAVVLRLHVLALLLEVAAVRLVIDEHSNILPRRRVPVRVVVALLRALESVPVAVVILAGVLGRVTAVHVLVGGEKTAVPVAGLAVLVVLVVLVHAVLEDRALLAALERVRVDLLVVLALVVGDRVRGGTITDLVTAHVLENDVAVNLGVVAGVLGSPLDHQLGA